MSDEIKKYEDNFSSWIYSPFRDHSTEFGWGIRHLKTGRIFGYIGEKSCCFGVAAALNGYFEAAKIYLENSNAIIDEYFERFKQG